MRIKEFRRDIFTMPKDFVIAHAVSADFVMGGGLALQVVHKYPEMKRFLLEAVRQNYIQPDPKVDNVFMYTGPDDRVIYNLVTKTKVWQNSKKDTEPNLSTLSSALTNMRGYMAHRSQKKLALPMIGCGLDQMNWDDVKVLIEKVFSMTDVDIAICLQ